MGIVTWQNLFADFDGFFPSNWKWIRRNRWFDRFFLNVVLDCVIIALCFFLRSRSCNVIFAFWEFFTWILLKVQTWILSKDTTKRTNLTKSCPFPFSKIESDVISSFTISGFGDYSDLLKKSIGKSVCLHFISKELFFKTKKRKILLQFFKCCGWRVVFWRIFPIRFFRRQKFLFIFFFRIVEMQAIFSVFSMSYFLIKHKPTNSSKSQNWRHFKLISISHQLLSIFRMFKSRRNQHFRFLVCIN